VPLRYKVYYSEQALAFSLTLSRKDQVLLTHFIGRLAERPSNEGDYREPDDEGRLIEVRVHGRHAVLYWMDHAVAKLMVTEIRLADRRP
jgi:hypothetical protein